MRVVWRRKVAKSGIVETAWAEVVLDADWIAAYRLIPQGGRLVFGELRVFPNEPDRKAGIWSAETTGHAAIVPPGGITAQLLRLITVGADSKQLLDRLAELRESMGDEFISRRGVDVDELAKDAALPAERDDGFYARIAARYVELLAAGDRRPVAVIASEISRPAPYVRDALHLARQRGLLTAGTRGRAAGRLTPKGRRALERTTQPREEEADG